MQSVKFLIVFNIVLLNFIFANLLDTNDLKMNSFNSTGGNPAAIVEVKTSKLKLSSVLDRKIKQNSKVLNLNIFVNQAVGNQNISGADKNPQGVADASKYFSYTTKLSQENWIALKYQKENIIYPLANFTFDNDKKAKMVFYRHDSLEKASLSLARDISGLALGIELASNIYNQTENFDYNQYCKNNGVDDVNNWAESKPYYTLTLGAIKNLNDATKISVAHKFSQNRGIYWRINGETYTDVETLPNETDLGYIFRLNKNFELAATYKMYWGTSYQTQKKGNNPEDDQNAVTKHPYNTIGLSGEYSLSEKWTIQSYANYTRNYKKIEYVKAADNNDDMNRGYQVTQIGGNIQYNLNTQAQLLLGAYTTKLLSEDNSINYNYDLTDTYLSYSYNF